MIKRACIATTLLLLIAAPNVFAAKKVASTISFSIPGGGHLPTFASSDLTVDLDSGKVSANGIYKTEFGSEKIALTGTIHPATRDITGLFTGNENVNFSGGDYRRTSFRGTLTLENQSATRDSYSWRGPVELTYTQITLQGAVQSQARQGVAYKGTMTINPNDYKEKLPPVTAPDKSIGKATRISGDVEYSKDCGKTFQALTPGTKIEKGYIVTTGFDSTVQLDFGYGTINISQITYFRIDDSIKKENITKTQMYLRVGAIAARVKHTEAIRGDFSVRTPTANSSIRGSEMIVDVEKDTGKTTVYVTEDVAYVKGDNDAAEIEITEGNQTTVGTNKKATPQTPYDPETLPGEVPSFPSSGGSMTYGAAAVILIIIVAAIFLKRKKKA